MKQPIDPITVDPNFQRMRKVCDLRNGWEVSSERQAQYFIIVLFFQLPFFFPGAFCWSFQGCYLGGGFKYFLFSSLFGEMIQFDEYFSDGLIQPPTGVLFGCFQKWWYPKMDGL